MARKKYLSATTIAQASFCEKKLVLDKVYGKQTSDIQELRQHRGNEEHLRHHLVAQRYGAPSDGRCFIASELYGNVSYETNLLRNYRDTNLANNTSGKLLTAIYYEVSPLIVMWIQRSKLAHALFKKIIDYIVRRLERA